jgi:hypothetical protein
MTDIDVHDLVRAATVLQDWAGRQLSTLRTTFPAWDIERERDPAGRMWWTARLRRPLTADMAVAGVLRTVQRPDAIALAGALAWQTALLHHARSNGEPL